MRAPCWRLIAGAGTERGGAFEDAPRAARGARNMAVDHVLLESVRSGGPPVLRLYTWSPACLSFGRNQHVRDTYDEARIRAAGVDVVRRPTGGLSVLHDRELTYCVLAPAALLGGPRQSYRTINAALVEGLRALGVPAAPADAGTRADPRRDALQPCFRTSAEGEVVAEGRKLVGSAQRTESGIILQHGSILLGGSQDRMLDFLRPASRPAAAAVDPIAPRAPALLATRAAGHFTTVAEVLGRTPGWPELSHALAAAFEAVCGTRLAPGSLTRQERARLPAVEAGYENPAWTWRR